MIRNERQITEVSVVITLTALSSMTRMLESASPIFQISKFFPGKHALKYSPLHPLGKSLTAAHYTMGSSSWKKKYIEGPCILYGLFNLLILVDNQTRLPCQEGLGRG